MLLAKKYFLSFLIIASLGILQFNMISGIKPAQADSALLATQGLLQQSAAPAYGSTAPKDIKIIALKILATILSFLAILTLALLLFAGFKYMTSGGDESKIKEAMGQIKALIVGLIIILSSWGITMYVLRVLICTTTTSGTSCNTFW